MNQIVLDTCVAIDLMEKPSCVQKIRAGLRGKQVTVILCDTVLREIYRVRGIDAGTAVTRIAKLLQKKIIISKTTEIQRAEAGRISAQYATCHTGDNMILALCKMRDFILVTLDGALLQACGFVGVAAFRPERLGGL